MLWAFSSFWLEQAQALMDAARRGKSPEQEVVLGLMGALLRAADICSPAVADAHSVGR